MDEPWERGGLPCSSGEAPLTAVVENAAMHAVRLAYAIILISLLFFFLF